jgi:uncharacterized protein YyaL (SSP411 family)
VARLDQPMPNALAAETSPYLRQHQDNPVDWLPWGETALGRAREHDRPLLVSIGYSSCHWCHVMERESFEDERVADLMNRGFVCVKVDREERPDIDAIYMEAVQAMTGHGGWPLNVFLTPEQVPFFGGTYFPPEPRHGMPSWPQVLDSVAEAWAERREEIRAGSARIRERLTGGAALSPSSRPLDPSSLGTAVAALGNGYDARRGGFGGAPKFPPTSTLEFLLRRAAARPGEDAGDSPEAAMAVHTLRAMAAGGIHDQVGGGFSRYAVDATWTVPHFEKMLYDNALLARAYLHGWQVSGDERLLEVALGALRWALREMRGPEGGFYSALDADSEGVEGKFYVWSIDQLERALGDDADAAIAYFGASEEGNFEGANVLEARGPRPDPPSLASIRQRLLAARELRVRPALDDKRVTSWNALMISALAEVGAVLGAREAGDDWHGNSEEGAVLLDAARECAGFLLDDLRDDRGRLLRTYNDGRAKLDAYLEDHAFLLEALLTLYESTFEERWFIEARGLADTMIERFADPERGGFFSTASDHEPLLTRRKDLEDAPIPSGASSAAFGLLRLAALSGEHEYERHAVGVLRLLHELAPRHPTAFGHLLQALEFHVSPVREVALVGPDVSVLARVVREALRPHLVVAGGPGDGPTSVPLLEGRTPIEHRAAAYVCERFACQRPVTEPDQLARALVSSSRA